MFNFLVSAFHFLGYLGGALFAIYVPIHIAEEIGKEKDRQWHIKVGNELREMARLKDDDE